MDKSIVGQISDKTLCGVTCDAECNEIWPGCMPFEGSIESDGSFGGRGPTAGKFYYGPGMQGPFHVG